MTYLFQLKSRLEMDPELFQYCLTYTMYQKLAPFWNKTASFLVKGEYFAAYFGIKIYAQTPAYNMFTYIPYILLPCKIIPRPCMRFLSLPLDDFQVCTVLAFDFN